mgnify:CR=1 FL=1
MVLFSEVVYQLALQQAGIALNALDVSARQQDQAASQPASGLCSGLPPAGREQGQHRDLPSRPRQAGRFGDRAGAGRPAAVGRAHGQDREPAERGAGQGAGLLASMRKLPAGG